MIKAFAYAIIDELIHNMAKSKLQLEKEREQQKEELLQSRLKSRTKEVLESQKSAAITIPVMAERIGQLASALGISPTRPVTTFNRSFKTSDEGKIMTAVAGHMYGAFKAPQHLVDGLNYLFVKQKEPVRTYHWARIREQHRVIEVNLSDVSTICSWYLIVASGGSLWKSATRYVEENGAKVPALTRQENHYFLNCPIKNATFREALIYAIARNFTSDLGTINRICKSKIIDLPMTTSPPLKFLTRPLWRQIIEFFATHQVTIQQINDLVDYLQHAGQNPNFTMKGKTVASLTKAMNDWHYELARVKRMGNADWTAISVQIPEQSDIVTEIDGKRAKWKMKQITTSKALAAEGTAMRHCVYSYQDRCITGHTAIWSLQKFNDQMQSWDRALTIEMRVAGMTLVQIRGIANRAARLDERHAVRDWCIRNNVSISTY